MFDPFDTGANPFSSAFQTGRAHDFVGRQQVMERQREALDRARKRRRELQDNELKHGEKMSKDYKTPFQPGRDWATAAMAAASTGLQVAKENGLFQNRSNNPATPFNMNTLNQLGKSADWNKVASPYTQIGSPSSWGFDLSKAF